MSNILSIDLMGSSTVNNDRRKAIAAARTKIEAAQALVDEARSDLEDLESEEREYFDNMPESLQGGDRGQQAEAAADSLQAAIDTLDNLDFEEAYGQLDEAVA